MRSGVEISTHDVMSALKTFWILKHLRFWIFGLGMIDKYLQTKAAEQVVPNILFFLLQSKLNYSSMKNECFSIHHDYTLHLFLMPPS
jgi:hypothetical protein